MLTPARRQSTLRLMNDALATLVSQALEGRSVRKAAELCQLPEHQLSAVIYGRSRRPHPDTLLAIAGGLGIPYEKLALAAYGIIHAYDLEGSDDTPPLDETPPVDSDSGHQWNSRAGRKRAIPSPAT